MSNIVTNNINGLAANSFANLFHVQDRKPAGTSGDNMSTGHNVRTINTVLYNNINGASLLNDVVTLPAGTYFVQGFCASYVTDQSKAVVHNKTDGTDLLIGLTLQSYDAGGGSCNHSVMGVITLAAEKEIQMNFHTANAGHGGVSTSAGNEEVYLDLLFWKIV